MIRLSSLIIYLQRLKPFIAKNKQVLLKSFSESFREIGVGITISVIVMIFFEDIVNYLKLLLVFITIIVMWYISIVLSVNSKKNE